MALRKLWTPDRRDMIWIDCNPQAGREMKDMHPLLVLSPKAFNERTGIVIGLPVTTAAFNETNPFAVKFEAPRKKTSYILGHQPKSFDWRVRQARPHPWKQIPEEVFTECLTDLGDRSVVGQPILAAAAFQTASSASNTPPGRFPATGPAWRADRKRHLHQGVFEQGEKSRLKGGCSQDWLPH